MIFAWLEVWGKDREPLESRNGLRATFEKVFDVMPNRNESRVLEFLEEFKDRMKPADVENVREMVKHHEWYEGFDILCAQLYESSSPITQQEYKELRGFVNGGPINWEHDYIKELIRDDSPVNRS